MTSSWEAQVARFSNQYVQVESDLDFPEPSVLKFAHVQDALYQTLFADGALKFGPPSRYQLRVLKELVKRVEASIDDWDEYVSLARRVSKESIYIGTIHLTTVKAVSDELMSALSVFLATPLPAETATVQQRSYVTYRLSALDNAELNGSNGTGPPQITLLENRNLFAASGTTGLRTWEAALHLGTYLCENSSIVKGKHVLELGAGTGYLCILCSILGSTHVIASDGSDDVINFLPENLFLNNLQDSGAVTPMEVKWGHALLGTEEDKWNGGRLVDVVLGADLTYDHRVIPALVGTLLDVFELYPSVEVYFSAAQRNEKTFQVFLDKCQGNGLTVEDAGFQVPGRESQEGPFYDDQVAIRICKVLRV